MSVFNSGVFWGLTLAVPAMGAAWLSGAIWAMRNEIAHSKRLIADLDRVLERLRS